MNRMLSLFMLVTLGCTNFAQDSSIKILPGSWQTESYFSLLEGKKLGLTVNHSSTIENTHLVDSLLNSGINVSKVFTPEHGFKGSVSDGAEIDYKDQKAPYELVSLYGKNKKPTTDQMRGIELMIFDIQDVGARFYTYISTMHLCHGSMC